MTREPGTEPPSHEGLSHEGPKHDGLSRRTMMAGVAATGIGASVLVACGSGSDGDAAGTGASSPASEGSSPASEGSSPSGDEPLAATGDIEVGGAVFLEEPSVVITQPVAGEFHAFDRTCTHRQCPVLDLVEGNIHCDCHQSMFSATDGSPVSGPATAPLAAFEILVDGDQILPA